MCLRNTTAAADTVSLSTLLSSGCTMAKKKVGKTSKVFFSACLKLQQSQTVPQRVYHSGDGQRVGCARLFQIDYRVNDDR